MQIKHALDIDNKKIVYDGCMVTYSGTIVNLFDVNPLDIHIEDIAHGLAYTCRWNGAVKSYFSVAEHCCMMYDQAPEYKKATALFHDCEEAYWGDIIKPVKNMLPPEMRQKMKDLRTLIFDLYKVPSIDEYIDDEDFRLLKWDFNNLILSKQHNGMNPEMAEKEWLIRYYELIDKKLIIKP
jgi:hypothetical protein